MTDEIITELRSAVLNLRNTVIRSMTLDKSNNLVIVNLVTDCSFTQSDQTRAHLILRKYIPGYFDLKVKISKLAPDAEMIKRKIYSIVGEVSKTVYATISPDDILVSKTDIGFEYSINAVSSIAPENLCERVNAVLKDNFCGEFSGKLIKADKSLEELEVEEYVDEPEYEMPVRTFAIEDFNILEGDKIQKTAVYLSDLNLTRDEVIICGEIEEVRERSYVNKNGTEKKYFNIVINDTTASAYVTYFPRLKTIEKIRKLKAGDSIVCTGLNEEYKGEMRYTAKVIDLGKIPSGFVPQKRTSKPVPKFYKTVRPEPFADIEQTDLFADSNLPECLKREEFVVFDLETTGLNSSPVSGNMDRIIEIGAFKISNGAICESFTTFINPGRKLSDEIISLTGITEEMIKDAPPYEQVMPDFYKFCQGCILVGHNIAGFDYKFVDHYLSTLGYILDRKIIDTIPLSQELLFLSNYKLNTVADKFNITFNHHRAIDDALTTAKIFIELIKLKKSLPKFQ